MFAAIERQITGEEAKKIIDHLHGKPVSTEANLIGTYRGEHGTATMYQSTYGSEMEAAADGEAMSRLISGGNEFFHHYHRLEIHGTPVSMCLGMGQVHYFFPQHERLYWLAVDSPVAQETIAALVKHVTN